MVVRHHVSLLFGLYQYFESPVIILFLVFSHEVKSPPFLSFCIGSLHVYVADSICGIHLGLGGSSAASGAIGTIRRIVTALTGSHVQHPKLNSGRAQRHFLFREQCRGGASFKEERAGGSCGLQAQRATWQWRYYACQRAG